MGLLGQLRLSLWTCALGALVVYAFFVGLAGIPPQRVGAVSVVAVVLAALITLRNLRVNKELADPGGDPRVRRALNRQRERRGF